MHQINKSQKEARQHVVDRKIQLAQLTFTQLILLPTQVEELLVADTRTASDSDPDTTSYLSSASFIETY